VNSKLIISESESVPDSQRWSICSYCAWKYDQNRLYWFYENQDQVGSLLDDYVNASWSQWGEFFHFYKNDRFKLYHKVYSANEFSFNNTLFITKPVFLLPMITFHVGHLLVDVLEQLYSMMIDTYGEIRRDCIILIDVAGEEERAILQTKIDLHTDKNSDLFANMLNYFSDFPKFSVPEFFNLLSKNGKHIIFLNLHLGLDISKTYYSKGYSNHPCIFKPSDVSHLSVRYQHFRDFLWENGPLHINPEKNNIKLNWPLIKQQLNIVIIQRDDNRVITNLHDVLHQIQVVHGFNTSQYDLNKLPFSQQLIIFSKADILVAVAGTALHNAIFMRPGTIIIILMQPGW
jgi:hypothetical protein